MGYNETLKKLVFPIGNVLSLTKYFRNKERSIFKSLNFSVCFISIANYYNDIKLSILNSQYYINKQICKLLFI